MSGNFTPSTDADMIAHFENAASPLTTPFYYEASTNTINFGYGSNLTGAETSALNGDATLKKDYDSWLKANGISLTAQQWASFASSNLTSANGPGIADTANAQIGGGDWTQAALSVLNAYVQSVVDPALQSNISGFASLPSDEKIAFENIYYVHNTLLGPLAYGDAESGDLSGAAEQIAFNSEAAQTNQSGLAERFLGSGLLALGITPTYGTSNNIVGLDASQSNIVQDTTFLEDILTSNQLGHNGETAFAYVGKWGSGPSASLTTSVAAMESFLLTQGVYVASTLNEIPSVDTTNIAFSKNSLQLYNASSYSGLISGFQTGTILDLANVGTASSATISADNVLTVSTGQGSVNLDLAPGVDYTTLTPVISADGNGGTTVDLQPAAVVAAVAFDPTTAGFVNGQSPILTGIASSPNGVAGVELYEGDPANGGQDLGSATLKDDGTWTFQANIGSGDFNALTAVVTDNQGQTAAAGTPYELVTGIGGEPFHAQEFDFASDGSYGYIDYAANGAPLVDASDNGDDTHRIIALADHQTLQSIGNDVMTGSGIGERFVFSPNFGQDEITDFAASGQSHDTIDLSQTDFQSLAQLLRHTTMSDGSAVIHLNSQDSITLDSITKAELKAHPKDFAFG